MKCVKHVLSLVFNINIFHFYSLSYNLLDCQPHNLPNLHLTTCQSLHLYISPSVNTPSYHLYTSNSYLLYICPHLYLITCTSVHMSNPYYHMYISPTYRLHICQSAHLSILPPVHLPIWLPFKLFICPPKAHSMHIVTDMNCHQWAAS